MKVLASDFDYTLYFDDHFNESDLRKIKEFQQDGNLFGICTGRQLAGLIQTIGNNFKPDFYILSSGTHILDKDLNLIYEKSIDFNLIKEIYLKYKEEVNLVVHTLDASHFYCTNLEGEDYFTHIKDIDEMKDYTIYSISFVELEENRAIEIEEEIRRDYKQVSVYQNNGCVDVVEKGCSKGEGINILKKLLNINEVSGIGDSYNDLPMLEMARPSFTFHSSPDEVKKMVDYRVDSIKEAIEILGEVH